MRPLVWRRGGPASFSIRHSSGPNGHVAEAREALGLTFKFVEAFQAERTG